MYVCTQMHISCPKQTKPKIQIKNRRDTWTRMMHTIQQRQRRVNQACMPGNMNNLTIMPHYGIAFSLLPIQEKQEEMEDEEEEIYISGARIRESKERKQKEYGKDKNKVCK